MTDLDKLIQASVQQGAVRTTAPTTDKIAEQMARELLADESFRSEMRDLMLSALSKTRESIARRAATAPD